MAISIRLHIHWVVFAQVTVNVCSFRPHKLSSCCTITLTAPTIMYKINQIFIKLRQKNLTNQCEQYNCEMFLPVVMSQTEDCWMQWYGKTWGFCIFNFIFYRKRYISNQKITKYWQINIWWSQLALYNSYIKWRDLAFKLV